jgi:hypothetical protein
MIDEEHHEIMNKARVQQSLPPEYLKFLLTIAKLQEQKKEQDGEKFQQEYLNERGSNESGK